jgi:D-tyrosyl-tRNA(Tyr) deacylase
MRVLVQRVKKAAVTVNGQEIAAIGKGLLVFVGIGKGDTETDLDFMGRKIAGLRIFEDADGKMNLDIGQVRGSILSVSQFTLYANTKKGNRPGFDRSASPDAAKKLWLDFNENLRQRGIDVREGLFGAHMEVSLINDGPVTLWLDSKASE